MKISIYNSLKLSEIREQFHQRFPYLKLEFFSDPHKIGEKSNAQYIQDHDKRVSEVRSLQTEGEISLKGNMKTFELEQEFQKFGLPVQVFRLSGNSWIETIQTDAFTLDIQNLKGHASIVSDRKKYNSEEIENFDLYEQP